MTRLKRTRSGLPAKAVEARAEAREAVAGPRRIKPKRVRRDPSNRREIDHSAEWTKLQDKDPDVKYVLASLERPHTGVNYYKDLGYEVCEHEQGGVRFGAGANEPEWGAPMEMFGNVLMGIHKDDWEDIQQNGPDGQSGYRLHDELEKAIIAPGGVDSMRGQLPGHLRMENETTDKYRSEEI